MTIEESTRIELRETGGESRAPAKPSELPSGPLLANNAGQAATENGGNVHEGYEKKRTFTKRRIRIYTALCIIVTILLLLVLVISLSLTVKGPMHKVAGTTTPTVATVTTTQRSSSHSPTSRSTYQTIPAVILNIDSVAVSLSLTFPYSIYKEAYSDPDSSEYRVLESNITGIIDGIFQNGEFSTVYDRVTVDDIRSGSIIIDTTIHLIGIPTHLHNNIASSDVNEIETFIGEKIQSNIEDDYPTDEILILQLKGAKITFPTVSTLPQEITIPIVHNQRCFPCTSSGDCIPLSWVCDGDIDCNEGEDEINCPCDEGFLCGSGLCVDNGYRCDGLSDCEEGEDEMNCTCILTSEYQCPYTNSCIPKSALCDFTPDCLHHEDESEEVCQFESFAEYLNLTTGGTRVINLPIPLQKVGFVGPGAFALWFFSSPGVPTEFLINVTLSIIGSGGSFMKFGRGLNATRSPLAAFKKEDAVSPADLNPFYARSEDVWVVLYQSDYDIVEGSFSVTAVPASNCTDGAVTCEFSPECIPPGGRCDGNRDCTFSGEDETLCLSPLNPDEMRNDSDFSSSDSFSSSAYFEN